MTRHLALTITMVAALSVPTAAVAGVSASGAGLSASADGPAEGDFTARPGQTIYVHFDVSGVSEATAVGVRVERTDDVGSSLLHRRRAATLKPGTRHAAVPVVLPADADAGRYKLYLYDAGTMSILVRQAFRIAGAAARGAAAASSEPEQTIDARAFAKVMADICDQRAREKIRNYDPVEEAIDHNFEMQNMRMMHRSMQRARNTASMSWN